MAATQTAATIRLLSIRRFRGIAELEWRPSAGLNVLLGGGDVGKSTVLEAVALLLSPSNTVRLSDSDYHQRKVEDGFEIEAAMWLPPDCGITQTGHSIYPWHWDGTRAVPPRADGTEEGTAPAGEGVYVLRLRATPEFETFFEAIQPDGTPVYLPVTVRRNIGLVALSGDDRNDRDLRLLQGSALDRLVADTALRPKLARRLGEADVISELSEQGKTSLTRLSASFAERQLPSELRLGLSGGQGFTVNALIGLTAASEKDPAVHLPLLNWGAGTRRLASLEVAAALQTHSSIVVVDEVERALEPHRQRVLMRSLQKHPGQVFVTTHSSVALSAAEQCAVWHMGPASAICQIERKAAEQLRRDPEAFLSRLTIVAEGVTEVGYLEWLLRHLLREDPLDCGIWVTDGGGNENALGVLEALSRSGIAFGAFVDNEGRFEGRWAALRRQLGPLLWQWVQGCTESEVISAFPADSLRALVVDPSGEKTGERMRTLALRAGIEAKGFDDVSRACEDVLLLIIQAATGYVPDDMEGDERKQWKKHPQHWFKSRSGGNELAEKTFSLGAWPQLSPRLSPFISAIAGAVGAHTR